MSSKMWPNRSISKRRSAGDGNDRSGLGADHENRQAIVTNSGGRTSMRRLSAANWEFLALSGTGNATKVIKDRKAVTVSCAEGEEGKVYEGILKFEVKTTNLKEIKKTKTKIMMNVGNPDQAFDLSFIPNDGVGLAREEFIITEYIKIHPMALIHFDKVKDKEEKKKINELTQGYKSKEEFFVDKLAEGIGRIRGRFLSQRRDCPDVGFQNQ